MYSPEELVKISMAMGLCSEAVNPKSCENGGT